MACDRRIEKFGNDVERDYIVNHYDYTIANSDFLKPIFARAFNVTEAQVFVTGIPNNDKILIKNLLTRLLRDY